MSTHKRISTILVLMFLLNASVGSPALAQQGIALRTAGLTISSPEDQLHALALTRFHFITLKEFHSGLFLEGEKGTLQDLQARLLNVGLNAFLTSTSRETVLLEALRQNKGVQLRFSVPQKKEGEYRLVKHPHKELLHRFQPVVENVPITIELRPLLDGPVAFRVTLNKGTDTYGFDVDWSGKILSQ